jgi:hypothetical protein
LARPASLNRGGDEARGLETRLTIGALWLAIDLLMAITVSQIDAKMFQTLGFRVDIEEVIERSREPC